ncbi:MAG: hypothetical protein COB53_00140 [Elusimicrobia bacterium]|nr:MAG: hypothetical protein COB53_00140 [Elusimicrobiota bacterium]
MPATEKIALKKVGYVILYVKDAEKACGFYEGQLGLKVRMKDKNWSELETEGFTLALHGAENLSEKTETTPVVVFNVEDIKAAHAQLKDSVGADPLKSVCEFDGMVGVSTEFKDPDGNRLSVFGMLKKEDWES